MAVPSPPFVNTDLYKIWLALGGSGGGSLGVVNFGDPTAALRTAAQIGNSTGAAAFGTGAAGAQVLRTVTASDSPEIPLLTSGGLSAAQLLNIISDASSANGQTLAEWLEGIYGEAVNIQLNTTHNLKGVAEYTSLMNSRLGDILTELQAPLPNHNAAPQDISGNTDVYFSDLTVTGDEQVYTVTGGKILYLTHISLALTFTGSGSFAVRDGNGGTIFHADIQNAAGTFRLTEDFSEPVKISTGVYFDLFGGVISSGYVTGHGYEK